MTIFRLISGAKFILQFLQQQFAVHVTNQYATTVQVHVDAPSPVASTTRNASGALSASMR
jgi:hypothetical protein